MPSTIASLFRTKTLYQHRLCLECHQQQCPCCAPCHCVAWKSPTVYWRSNFLDYPLTYPSLPFHQTSCLRRAIYSQFLNLPCSFGKAVTLEAALIGLAELGPVEYALVIGPVAELVVIPGPMGMALVVVVITRPLVMALVILEPLVMAKPVVMALVTLEPLVMHLVVVVMAEPVVNALGLEQRKVPNQPVRYIVYATEWCCRHILQGNSSHLLWGCLSLYPRSLISRVAPLVHMHIGLGSVFPQIPP